MLTTEEMDATSDHLEAEYDGARFQPCLLKRLNLFKGNHNENNRRNFTSDGFSLRMVRNGIHDRKPNNPTKPL